MQELNELLNSAISGNLEAQKIFECDEDFQKEECFFDEEKYFDDRERAQDIRETFNQGNRY